MSGPELTLLLYLETCAVDYGGTVDGLRMNEEDFSILHLWKLSGFVEFGRLYSKDCQSRPHGRGRSHWCRLGNAAFKTAHDERRTRAGRMWDKRRWRKSEEK